MPTFRRSATLEARDGNVPELPEDFMARVRGINLVQSNALPTRNPTPAVDQSMGRRLFRPDPVRGLHLCRQQQ
jgi:hypothetical protein